MEDKESVQISKYISVEDTGKVQNFHFIACRLRIGMFKKTSDISLRNARGDLIFTSKSVKSV